MKMKTLLYLASFLYSKYSHFYVFYMIVNYYKISRRKRPFILRRVHPKIFTKLLDDSDDTKVFDASNAVIMNGCMLFENEKLIKVGHDLDNKTSGKTLFVTKSRLCLPDEIIAADVVMHNMNFSENVFIKNVSSKTVEFADEVHISFITNPSVDLTDSSIDVLMTNYFKVPRLVYTEDLFQMNIGLYAKEVYYNCSKDNRVNGMGDVVYFKVKKVIKNDKEYKSKPLLCCTEKTVVKQSTNIADFLPVTSDYFFIGKGQRICDQSIGSCPYGLVDHFERISDAVKPFLTKRKIKFNPLFLIQGPKGSGQELILSMLALKLGMNFFKVSSVNFAASIYAQNETKLINFFLSAKTYAPCVVVIDSFENFGKNNDGEYDDRIINHFSLQLKTFFSAETFPVILFCCSYKKDIPGQLKRLFLQVFDVDAPTESQREDILRWIMEVNEFSYPFDLKDLKEISAQTNGFLYEDLKALIHGAYVKMVTRTQVSNINITLEKCDVMESLDLMQSNYNESLGAPKVPKVEWSDIGGLTEVKEEIIKTINLPLKHPELLKLTGLKRTGILLYGPPGTGKTMLAKAIATECGLCFLSVKGPELLNMYVGQSEENVREVFERAKQASPCIIFFDELDSLAPNRGKSGDSGGVMDRVVSQLLAEMDGLNDSATIFTIGATNRPDLIDPALLRPGRFDKLLYVGPCTDKESKLSVLKALTRKFILDEEVSLEEVVDITPENITGADFYGMCSSAWMSAVRRLITNIEAGVLYDAFNMSSEDVTVNIEDFKNAIANVKPSVSKEDLRYFRKLKAELSLNT